MVNDDSIFPGLIVPDVSVSINLDVIVAQATQAIESAARIAAFGLTASLQSHPDVIRLPGALIGIGSPSNVDIAQTRIEFEESTIAQCLFRGSKK